MRDQAFFLAVILTVAALPASGQALPGNAAQGHALARDVCAECHGVGKGQAASRLPTAPTFQSIADAPTTTAIGLRVFLRTPHRAMPNLVLKESETDDIIAYILSLK